MPLEKQREVIDLSTTGQKRKTDAVATTTQQPDKIIKTSSLPSSPSLDEKKLQLIEKLNDAVILVDHKFKLLMKSPLDDYLDVVLQGFVNHIAALINCFKSLIDGKPDLYPYGFINSTLKVNDLTENSFMSKIPPLRQQFIPELKKNSGGQWYRHSLVIESIFKILINFAEHIQLTRGKGFINPDSRLTLNLYEIVDCIDILFFAGHYLNEIHVQARNSLGITSLFLEKDQQRIEHYTLDEIKLLICETPSYSIGEQLNNLDNVPTTTVTSLSQPTMDESVFFHDPSLEGLTSDVLFNSDNYVAPLTPVLWEIDSTQTATPRESFDSEDRPFDSAMISNLLSYYKFNSFSVTNEKDATYEQNIHHAIRASRSMNAQRALIVNIPVKHEFYWILVIFSYARRPDSVDKHHYWINIDFIDPIFNKLHLAKHRFENFHAASNIPATGYPRSCLSFLENLKQVLGKIKSQKSIHHINIQLDTYDYGINNFSDTGIFVINKVLAEFHVNDYEFISTPSASRQFHLQKYQEYLSAFAQQKLVFEVNNVNNIDTPVMTVESHNTAIRQIPVTNNLKIIGRLHNSQQQESALAILTQACTLAQNNSATGSDSGVNVTWLSENNQVIAEIAISFNKINGRLDIYYIGHSCLRLNAGKYEDATVAYVVGSLADISNYFELKPSYWLTNNAFEFLNILNNQSDLCKWFATSIVIFNNPHLTNYTQEYVAENEQKNIVCFRDRLFEKDRISSVFRAYDFTKYEIIDETMGAYYVERVSAAKLDAKARGISRSLIVKTSAETDPHWVLIIFSHVEPSQKLPRNHYLINIDFIDPIAAKHCPQNWTFKNFTTDTAIPKISYPPFLNFLKNLKSALISDRNKGLVSVYYFNINLDKNNCCVTHTRDSGTFIVNKLLARFRKDYKFISTPFESRLVQASKAALQTAKEIRLMNRPITLPKNSQTPLAPAFFRPIPPSLPVVIQPAQISSTPKNTGFMDRQYWYQENDIIAILAALFKNDPLVKILPPLHPYMHDRNSLDPNYEQRLLFQNLMIKAILQAYANNTVSVIPVNTVSELSLNEFGMAVGAGTHWVGIVIKNKGVNNIEISYLDSVNYTLGAIENLHINPLNDMTIYKDQFSVTTQRFLALFDDFFIIDFLSKKDRYFNNVSLTIDICLVALHQQDNSSDCGPFMLHNLYWRPQDDNIGVVTGSQLRAFHVTLLQNINENLEKEHRLTRHQLNQSPINFSLDKMKILLDSNLAKFEASIYCGTMPNSSFDVYTHLKNELAVINEKTDHQAFIVLEYPIANAKNQNQHIYQGLLIRNVSKFDNTNQTSYNLFEILCIDPRGAVYLNPQTDLDRYHDQSILSDANLNLYCHDFPRQSIPPVMNYLREDMRGLIKIVLKVIDELFEDELRDKCCLIVSAAQYMKGTDVKQSAALIIHNLLSHAFDMSLDYNCEKLSELALDKLILHYAQTIASHNHDDSIHVDYQHLADLRC